MNRPLVAKPPPESPYIGNKVSGSVGNKGGGAIDWTRVAGHVDVPERFRK